MTQTDLIIVGAGPVGLFCAFMACKLGMNVVIVDQKSGPNTVGRADALNARTLSMLKYLGLHSELLAIGKPCNTSSVFADGRFTSRDSSWWDALVGCEFKHFLMVGQFHLEKVLVDRLFNDFGMSVLWNTSVTSVSIQEGSETGGIVTCENNRTIEAKFIIGADGPHSIVRKTFEIPFTITRPEIRWAVVDAELDTDFPKVPDIVMFQNETADVAWIPRESPIDRFYVRIDDDRPATVENALSRVNAGMCPYECAFRNIVWFSEFSVKEAVAEHYAVQSTVFLVGDACHTHSVNGGQGLNTGLADAFNLIWKLNASKNDKKIPDTYETERRPVAEGVIKSSGSLVRSTKYSEDGNHANDYIKKVQEYSGYITGMGVFYGSLQPALDFPLLVGCDGERSWLFDQLEFNGNPHLLVYNDVAVDDNSIKGFNVIRVFDSPLSGRLSLPAGVEFPFNMNPVIIRPDLYFDTTQKSPFQ